MKGGSSMASTPAPNNASIEDVAVGQRMIIIAIIVNLVAAFLSRSADASVWGLIAIASAIVGIIGLLRVARGLGYSTGRKVLLLVAAFIPLISLIMLVTVNQRANEALKRAGYKVGLLGARRT